MKRPRRRSPPTILGATPDKISTSIPFDSDLSAWGVAAANSGNNFHLYDIGAIHGAATRLREKILKLAAFNLKVEPSELTIEDSVVKVPGAAAKQITFAELGRIAYNNQHLIPDDMEAGTGGDFLLHLSPCQAEYRSRRRPPGARAVYIFRRRPRRRRRSRQSHRARSHVLRYLIVGDNGTVINPDVVNGQVYGSAAHGIAVALGRRFHVQPGGPTVDHNLSRLRQMLDGGNAAGRSHSSALAVAVHLARAKRPPAKAPRSPHPPPSPARWRMRSQPFGVKVCDLPITPEAVWRLVNHNPEKERRTF